MTGTRLDLDAIRRRLATSHGKEYWRSLEELANDKEFLRLVEDEFPQRSPEWLTAPGRREVLRLLGASLALAGLVGCTQQPKELIVPYVRQPEQLVLGHPLFFATAMPLSGYGMGVVVQSHEGRPTKVEGNTLHPSSLGATDAYAQASILDLYDPDRSSAILFRGRISSWPKFLSAMAKLRDEQRADGGAGLHFLMEPVTSPTLTSQMRGLAAAFPQARWHQYQPVTMDSAYQAGRAAFGRPVQTLYDFTSADVTLALDSDFLAHGPGSLRYARQFADRRRLTAGDTNINRLYVVEPSPTVTGTVAEHRIPVRATDVAAFARGVAAQLGVGNTGNLPPALQPLQGLMQAISRDLQAHRGRSLVVAGEAQPASVHSLAYAMNQALGNQGTTVFYTEPVEAMPMNNGESIADLTAAMRHGEVEALIILGVNPVFSAPADLDFADAMSRVPLRVHLGQHVDETAELCHWHVPGLHYLELWSDIRADEGTVSVIQPLIEPLYGGKTAHEILAALTDAADASSYDLMRDYWRTQYRGADFEAFWRQALHDGVIPNTALPRIEAAGISQLVPPEPSPVEASAQALEIVFRPDPSIWDGRFANNGWLQELPKPITKLTWDNAALVSPATAQRLGLNTSDRVELTFRGRTVTAPVLITPGQADDSVAVSFGYGRTRAGRVGNNTGFNAYKIRPWQRPWFGEGLEIKKLSGGYSLAMTQRHHQMERREIIRTVTLSDFIRKPAGAVPEEHPVLSLYPEFQYTGYAWGMAIDQNVCTGCSACVIACQSENNIPVVGKDQVAREREMHWIRIDTYYTGSPDRPEIYSQPMLCQHCEKAPCEPVCPVAATTHSSEGLNQMVYNRCVGTRYCSNNCPYKVRRFNFYLYSDWNTESLYPLRNPNVTVRSRGVMEKCTFCIQRIESAKVRAELEDRRVVDGEIVPACAAACPTRAIVFGDLNDKNSAVAKLREHTLSYRVLRELNTQPRVSYLAVVRNPNPEIQTT